MKNIIKTCSLFVILGLVCGANAASPRVAATTKSMSRGSSTRMPTIVGNVTLYNSNSSGTASVSSVLLTNTDCIDGYTNCLKGADVCGPELEECTTKVLLHGKMSNCLGMLYQCSSSGISALFGTSSIDALSNVAVGGTNEYGEVTDYAYPTDGSVLGQMVIGANISNRLPTDQCVRKYQNCLKRDSVCGENFELCTSFNEFRKQSINCASILERCQSDGLKELFGSVNTKVKPSDDSRIGVAILEGSAFAAANAVNTCYKVIDTCLVNACTANPWRCVEGVNMSKIQAADFIAGGEAADNTTTSKLVNGEDGLTSDFNLYTSTGAEVRKFIKGSCLATIGGNKYCYMTFQEKTPKERDLADIDNQEDVFSLAYAARKEFANTKIQDILKKFDKRAKDNCIQALTSCVKTSCGRGVGTVCYNQSKKQSGNGSVIISTNNDNSSIVNSQNNYNGLHINNSANYNEIRSGCEALINTDANCQYAANSGDDGYTYAYTDDTVFTKLFPKYTDENTGDPIGAVASLNAMLASNYNDAAIEKLKKNCQTIAMGCIKSMCGADYTNCYRNRTDIMSGIYKTGGENANGFDRSMNRMGGVLDYNIVTGLCVNTIKEAKSCEEHLKIEAANLLTNNEVKSWAGASSVRDSWMDVANGMTADQTQVTTGCTVSETAAALNTNCDTYTVRECNTVDEVTGCAYTEEHQESIEEYTLKTSADTLLQKLLVDVEREAQAKYNAKLTREQNICLSNNSGGIMNAGENGSTFMWAKLKNGKIPTSYATRGLTSSDFTASNDLYGSFCRAKITMMSDDRDIQDYFANHDMTRYFAVGDAFTCGAWLTQSNLDEITKAIGKKARADAGEGSAKEKAWSIALPILVGTASTIGGWAGMDALQKSGTSLGGLMSGNKAKYDSTSAAKSCMQEISDAQIHIAKADSASRNGNYAEAMQEYNAAVSRGNTALSYVKQISSTSGTGLTKISTFTPISYTDDYAGEYSDSYEWDTDVVNQIIGTIAKFNGKTVGHCEDKCKERFEQVELILQGEKASPEKAKRAKTTYEDALLQCSMKGDNSVDDTAKKTCDNVGSVAISWFDSLVKTNRNAVAGREARAGGLTFANGKNIHSMDSDFVTILKYCQDHTNDEKTGNGRRIAWNAAAAAVAGTAGTLGTIAIQKAVRENKYDKAENEAIQKWMDEVGDKIKCYLGGTELGSYGEMISLEIN